MLPRDSIYCEAVSSPQDIYYEGSEDEDYDDAEARRQRYEAAGQQFLAGRVPMLLSATLKGPFDEESGWVNPWRSKNRTAHLQHRPEPKPTASQRDLRRPAASASASASPIAQKQAIEVLKNAECALPSPESLKQAPFTEARSRLQSKVSDWRDDGVSLSSANDGYDSWAATSPSRKLGKRKSKSSIGADSTGKRQRVESSEREIETPTSGRRARATIVGEQHTKTPLHTSSIYSHIRELTSKLPRQPLSSEDSDTLDFDDDEALISQPSSPDSPSTKMLIPSSSLSSPFSQPSLLRALSPVSLSSAQTPTKQRVPATQSPIRPWPSSGLSCLSEAPTGLFELSDLEMLGAGSDIDDDDGSQTHDDNAATESHSREEVLPSPEPLSFEEGGSVSCTDSVPRSAPPACSEHDEATSSADDASTAHNTQCDFMHGLEADCKITQGFITPFRNTTPTRMAHPIIYDDAEGSDDSSPDPSITALSSAQQPASDQSEATNLSRDASSNGNCTKTNSPPKSSALQSLSPQDGRINSRAAPNKIAQPYNSSPLKSSAALDKALHMQEEDSQQSKENVESKETKENPLPRTMRTNITISRPNLSEIVDDFTCKADYSKVDKTQEAPMARDAIAPSTASLSSHLPIEAAYPKEMDKILAQSSELPNVQEVVAPSLTQEAVSADSRPSLPMEVNEGPGMLETHTTGDTSENATNPELTAILADNHGQTRQQEQESQTLTTAEASESLVIPSQTINQRQPSIEDLLPSDEPASRRPATPEPQFTFTLFSSFMSPSPSHRRQARYSSNRAYNNIVPTSHGILISSKDRVWRDTTPKKRVSWAPLPHEETNGSGETISSETDTSSSLSRGRGRAVSPPPPPSTGLASDSLNERDMKFGDHFAAVADRSRGTQLQRIPTTSGRGSYDLDRQAPITAVKTTSPTLIPSPSRVSPPRGEKSGAKLIGSGWGGDDDDEPTDIVQDIFNEMDDFLQVWDVDAELNEARKAEKTRTAAGKEKVETLFEGDMDMGVYTDVDIAAQFF